MRKRTVFCGLCGLLAASAIFAVDPPADPLAMMDQAVVAPPQPVFVSPSVQKADVADKPIRDGLHYLEMWQKNDGGWERVENSYSHKVVTPGKHYENDRMIKDLAEEKGDNVADTCLAARTFLRAVVSGREPALAPGCKKALLCLCDRIEQWRDDRTVVIQNKVLDPLHDPGPHQREVRYYDATVDTFFALAVLAEASDRIQDAPLQKRVGRALEILRHKIENTQTPDGTWKGEDADPLSSLDLTFLKDLETAPQYDDRHPNIVSHCEAVRAISIACRHGVPFKDKTRLMAEAYMQMVLDTHWPLNANKPPPKHPPIGNTILAAVALGAQYQAATTAKYLADAAHRPNARLVLSSDAVRALDAHAAKTHAILQDAVYTYVRCHALMLWGPAMPVMEDVLSAITEFDPYVARAMRSLTRRQLLRRIGDAGQFLSDREREQRGDTTFGTATSVAALMAIEDAPLISHHVNPPPDPGN